MQMSETRFPGVQHPYQFATPQKLPLRHQLLNSGNKSTEGYQSVSGFKHTPLKVSLQEQFRGMRKNDGASMASLKSLATSFKATTLRNDIVAAAAEASIEESDFKNPDIHKSYTRLRALKQFENAALEQQ